MAKIAINGFGRIGRLALRVAREKKIEIVSINDLGDAKTMAHLFKYDSLYGEYAEDVSFDEKNLIIGKNKIRFFSEKDPVNLPWKELGVDIVLECSGVFCDRQGSNKHLQAGAKRVIISAPAKDHDIPTYLLGINEERFNPEKDLIISNASCTTNCLAPVVKIIYEKLGIKKGFFTTIHSYTNDQKILDLSHKDLRRARAAGLSIIPTSTGAAKAIFEVIPELKGKLDGLSLRVPTPIVSLIDIICWVEKSTNKEELNNFFEKSSQSEMKGILQISHQPLVSVDYKGNSHSSIVDSSLTMVIDDLIKVVAWYDNEWGYACRLVEMTEFISTRI